MYIYTIYNLITYKFIHYMHIYKHAYICTYKHAHIYAPIYMYVYVYLIYLYVYIIYIYIYIYILSKYIIFELNCIFWKDKDFLFSKYLKWTIYKIWNRFSSFESPTQFQEKWKIIKTQQSKMAGDKFLRNMTNKMKI